MNSIAQLNDMQGLPSAIHAEVAILGACMLDEVAILDAVRRLVPEDFSLDSHRRIFAAIQRLIAAGSGVDLITVRESLKDIKEIDSIGGPAYLAYLCAGIPRNLNVEDYVKIVKEKAILSQLIRSFDAAEKAAANEDMSSADLIAHATARLQEIADEAIDVELQSAADFLDSRPASEDGSPLAAADGIKTGFTQLDDLTGGLQRKALVVVAAVASGGKSAFACNLAYNTSVLHGHTVAFFPLEDQKEIAVRRMLSSSSGVRNRDLREGHLSPRSRRLVEEQTENLRAAQLYLDDTFDITMTRVRTRVMRLKRKLAAQGRTLDLIILDQLTHISQQDIDHKLRGDEKFGKQAHLAKLLAEEADCAVVLMCQLTQESGKRSDPRPTLFDLAGSGQIKNYARLIILLHRPEMWDKNDPSLVGLGEMIVAKNNEGKTKTCPVGYEGDIVRWSDDTAPAAKQAGFGGGQW